MIAILFALLLAALAVADIVTTARRLAAGGTESNPVARALFKAVGVVPGAIALKVLFLGAIAGLYHYFPYPAFLAGVAFVQAAIVANNIEL